MTSEGIIKFVCNWLPGEPPEFDLIAELNEYRSELHKFGLIGAYPDGLGYGNISIRIPGTDNFIITGSQTGHLQVLEAEHYSIITGYSIKDNTLECTGMIKASSESLSHAAVYQALPDVQAVIHVHNQDLWSNLIFNEVTTSPELEYGTVELALEIDDLLRQIDPAKNKIIVLGGHQDGIISFGPNIFDAANALLSKFF